MRCEACEAQREYDHHVHPEGCLCEWDGQRRGFTGGMVRIEYSRCPLHGSCAWVECSTPGWHEHPDQFVWVNPGDPTAGEVRVLVKADGTVTISEAALAQLLVDAGWERAR
ncbi:hypothetical protein NPS01_25330 [Nocardioides psychrotolerans]|uniref:Uncharacterized protein n=1 Tax=Nocardioides psychrotolerans TaxID=1005945 RepID=A0A1I3LND4_9ACTN|nr:hypothetical protein [Nocardioides psychrotolerans]GEP38870.1 hypothetical protein NPS01_25330 [Nocardioides psychrotolerans]SFI86241.1 hypothetical protein SAMN05216561_11438 [Nocardioides psychrotolerans]